MSDPAVGAAARPAIRVRREAKTISARSAAALRVLGWPWPTRIRVPVVAAVLVLLVGLGMSWGVALLVFSEQELALRRVADTYLDGISAAIFARVATGDRAGTAAALSRAMWFHQGIRELRVIVRLENGEVFSDVVQSGYPHDPDASPIARPDLARALQQDGFVIDSENGTGWALRSLSHDAGPVADIYAELDLHRLQERRDALRDALLMGTVAAGVLGGVLAYLLVSRMLGRMFRLLEGFERLQSGTPELIAERDLPPVGSEFRQLMHGFNRAVQAIEERRTIMERLAEQEKAVTVGRLAATIAHEVRNPLGGMSNALDTIRKFGADKSVSEASLNLIERGLRSIADVVGAVLATYRMPASGRPVGPEDFADLRLLIEPEARRRGLMLGWEVAVAGPLAVSATEIRQIVLNVLLNACEASPPGGAVSFAAAWHADAPRLQLDIEDDGPGLPVATASRLAQGMHPEATPAAGGMGLRVVAMLVRRLDGRVIVGTGTHGRGTRISVVIPAAPAPAESGVYNGSLADRDGLHPAARGTRP